MTAYELIQYLANFESETEVCVSQKPAGIVVPLRFFEFQDDVIKLYGDGSEEADG
jgi:hypothetical protein